MPDTLHPICVCPCHYLGDRRMADGVSLFDAVEAAVACSWCLGAHSVVLLSRQLANAPLIDPDAWSDPDPPKKPEGEDGG